MRMTADLPFCHGDELFMLTQWHRINYVGTGRALSFNYNEWVGDKDKARLVPTNHNFVIQSVAKDLGNIHFMITRCFVTTFLWMTMRDYWGGVSRGTSQKKRMCEHILLLYK